MNLESFILGTGGMMPLPGRNLTSMMLRREGDLYLFDCGEATQISLRRLNLKWKKIAAIFISHTHADHVTGLPGILMLSSQVDRDDPLYIYGPPKIREYIESSRSVLDMYINYEIVVREIPAADYGGMLHSEDDFEVRCFPLRHTKPCVGYSFIEKPRPGIFDPQAALDAGVPRGPLWSRLQSGETIETPEGVAVRPEQVMGAERKGRKVSFVTDTEYLPSIAKEVSGSDLLICEGMFKAALTEDAREKKHLTSVQAATIAKDGGGIGQMGLIHYSPRYTNRDLEEMLIEAREIFPDTFLCRDRMQIDLPYQDD